MLSCSKRSTTTARTTTTFNATLTGASESPAIGSTATGSATFTFDLGIMILTGSLSFSGITVTSAHIHFGAVGEWQDRSSFRLDQVLLPRQSVLHQPFERASIYRSYGLSVLC